ncbi:hypothetical protein [Dyella choica]|uniref:Lipoprotein n=1 Tax=Dyella choica TaxID=1927959 RepID=A0A3S0RH48_9GAMM|nr:hypothetical protein [Dyella choica]RUL68993.1 hypothetical protein EKH80_23115 [Dyella choica]
MNNIRASMKLICAFMTIVLLSLGAGCNDNHRWVQKAEISIPSENYETCIRSAVSSLPNASIVGMEYGRFELHVQFQGSLKDVRVYVQSKDNGKADLMFIGTEWSEPQSAKDEFALLSVAMSYALVHQCHKRDLRDLGHP